MTRDPHSPADVDPARQGADTGDPDAFLSFLKDNLEAIAVAVVMALVIKHFCVEAFKIPTSSMKPTLYGDGDDPLHPKNKGDRILVDKCAYVLRDPQRWDIPVFRYPLNRARNFIKRIVGLPGERLRISTDGDIWVRKSGDAGGEKDLYIPQKPRRVRERFYRRVYPPVLGPPQGADEHDPRRRMDRYWRVDEGPKSAWRLERHGLLVFGGGPRGVLRNAREIGTASSPDTWGISGSAGTLVRDVRFQCRVRLEPVAGEAPQDPTRLSLAWRADDEFQAVLALSTHAAESRAFIRRGAMPQQAQALDLALEHGGVHDVELEYVDGMLHVHVDGSERAAVPDGRGFADTRTGDGLQQFTLTAEGGGLQVEDLRIDRDLRYRNDWRSNPAGQQSGVDIPADSYFMLGDNVTNSSDSRQWRLTTTHLKGGETIRYEPDEKHYVRDTYEDFDNGSLIQAVDVDGILRTWSENDEDGQLGSPTTPAPFVRRELIVGRAFLTFWPCLPDFPGRLRFLR